MSQTMHSFIADGFADDCDELIHRCMKQTPVNFKVFSKIFREMQMSSIFHDRQSGAEIAELSEEVVNIAKHYMVANTGQFEESVVGLFLVYAMVNLQPFKDFAHLRIVDEDVPYIERIEQVARRDKRIDILYVLGRLLIENTRYLAAARERGMEPSYRKYLEGCATIDNLGLRPKGVFLRQNEELDIIKELTGLQMQYDVAKKTAKADDLKYTDAKFPVELDSSLKNVLSGFIQEKDLDDDEDEEEDNIKSIKDRAMKAKVNPIKHRMGVQERRKNTKTESPQASDKKTPHTSDIKSPPGKVKTGSPIKRVTPSKTRVKITNQRQKRKRSKDSDAESSGESESSIEPSNHDSECVDINLDDFDKAKLSTVSHSDADSNEVEIDSDKIRMGALPCMITSEDNGKSYQIEIIDRFNRSSTENLSRREFATNVEEVIKMPLKEKRDLKKTILKSRFKRMGIEPIANFKPT